MWITISAMFDYLRSRYLIGYINLLLRWTLADNASIDKSPFVENLRYDTSDKEGSYMRLFIILARFSLRTVSIR